MPILIGHRGAPLRKLENTVDSLRLAGELGADAVEFDVRASRDGHPVLLHDRTLDRFWGRLSPVGELTVAELRELRCAEHPDARIATLDEVAEKVEVRLVVDGKDPALVPSIVEILRRYDALGRSCFIGAPDVLGAVRDVLPDADIILSWSAPEPPGPDLLDRLRPSTLNLPWKNFAEPVCRAALEGGYHVWTYSVDTRENAERARSLGVEGLISNDLPSIA
ncbi:glycerophosphodiester phosphodiesterase [Nonomuraea phyllanthi]|uniref:glycerophosphodiester phosphodiesterase n=1 Tax=Nonomuraea phyllanthi TaxID=2219224 RepID=UPI001292F143|nr:glycerophosphodiester phosphodiesterase family protein [Nonomuraea phyllanthi]QFY07559.1 glycerophosphodiester phosphodiesterase [Nonomuraea phyllanthi]